MSKPKLLGRWTTAGFDHQLSRTCVPAIGSLLSSITMGVSQVMKVVEVPDEDYDLFVKVQMARVGPENVIRHTLKKNSQNKRLHQVLAIKLNTSEGVKWALYEDPTYDRIGYEFRRTYWVEEDTPTFNEVNKGGKVEWRGKWFNRSLHSIE